MKNEIFAVSAYNVITWHDHRLEWDPKDRESHFEVVYFNDRPDFRFESDLLKRIMMVLQRQEYFMIWFGIQTLCYITLWMNRLGIVTMHM